MMLTMRDVAERAGVSRATVSVVLGGRSDAVGINADTRRRVFQSAEELGYRRNELVRAVVSGHNRMLGFLVWQPEYEAVARMLGGALEEAEAQDYTIKVLRLRDNEIDQRTIARCLELRLAGVIVVKMPRQPLDFLHQEMSRRHVPVTTLGSSFAQSWGARVTANDEQGCHLLIEHLHGLGHRRIAFIGGNPSEPAGARREAGFRQAMREFGLRTPKSFILESHWHFDDAARCTQQLLEISPLPPTAIVCASDETAMIACRRVRLSGRRVPEDVSVTGFTDLRSARLFDPPLTTVALPFAQLGRAAVRHTLARVQQAGEFRDDPVEEILLPELQVRASTSVAPELIAAGNSPNPPF